MRIELSNGYTTIIDDADYDLIKRYSWFPQKTQCNIYARTKIKGKTIGLHRMIMGVTSSEDEVDHIDGDGLNNQRFNLRVCTSLQNNHNTKVHKDSAMGFKGVYYNKIANKYYARIKPPQEERVFLGSFDSPGEAAKAYNKAAVEYFGEFAKGNGIRAAEGTTSDVVFDETEENRCVGGVCGV